MSRFLNKYVSVGIVVLVSGLTMTLGNLTAFAANTPTLTQQINAGVLSTDILDGSHVTVASPAVAMSTKNFSSTCLSGGSASTGLLGTATQRVYVINPSGADNGWTLSIAATSGTTCQTGSTTLGVSSQKIRVSNTTSNASWSVTIAPTAGSTALWASGSNRYDMNDTSGSGCTDGADSDSYAGRLSVSPSTSTITPQSGCTNTGVTKGSDTGFTQGTTDTITLLSASSSAATSCYWDLTGVGLQQSLPAFQASGAYSMPMTITATAL